MACLKRSNGLSLFSDIIDIHDLLFLKIALMASVHVSDHGHLCCGHHVITNV